MTVKFHPKAMTLKPENLNTDKVVPVALKALFDLGYGIEYQLKVDGEINVRSGNGQVRVMNVQFLQAFKLAKPERKLRWTRLTSKLHWALRRSVRKASPWKLV